VYEPRGHTRARRRPRRRCGEPPHAHRDAGACQDLLRDALPAAHELRGRHGVRRPPGAPLNPEIAKRLSALRRENPEWESWLGLLEAALEEVESGTAWRAAVPPPVTDGLVKAPCLHGAEIELDGRTVRQWLRSLLKLARRGAEPAAASLEHLKSRRLDGIGLLEAAVRQHDGRIDGIAAAAGVAPQALRVVAQTASLPLLHACGAGLAHGVQASWWEGYCPVCGAWPALAELRGLDRKRWLRCGRCGVGWEAAWLRCPFCGETGHEHLGYLAPEGDEESWKIEVCKSCKGYVKAVTTVRAVPAWAVPIDDLAMVHLDVLALERGYQRPARPGFEVDVRIRERRAHGLGAWLGFKGKGDGGRGKGATSRT
jgi:FdhE protein